MLAILALVALGGWISGELVKQHADVWGSTSTVGGFFGRVCQAGEQVGFDCTGTLKSSWAEIRLPIPWYSRVEGASLRRVGVPVALAGLSYFVFLGVWFVLVGGPRPFGTAWHRLPRAVALCGALASIFFLGLMATGRAPWCLWCIAIHAINFILLAAIERLCRGDLGTCHAERSEASQPFGTGRLVRAERVGFFASLRMMRSPLRMTPDVFGGPAARPLTYSTRDALQTVGVAFALIAGLWLYHHQHLAFGKALKGLRPYQRLVRSMREDPVFLLREYDAQPRLDLPARDGDTASDGRPRLVVFTDFQCSACGCNARIAEEQIIPAFGGRLDLVLRHYPLCRKCNDQVSADRHPLACDAAYAAEAARIVGGENGFRRMCDLLFRHRKTMNTASFPALAQQIGLDVAGFQSAMNSSTVQNGVRADIELGRQLGISGTPTMFLDGRRVPELCQTPVFWKAVASRCELANGHAQGAASGVVASMPPTED